MMKLQKLEISGFKSFVDPVSLDFSPGITAIVGPNGCGKSNISDAISWVLGEQSAKSLRSGTMAEVIFNGAERRKPLGMAEVTLTLESDDSVEGVEDGRIVINRRVFRSGEGQYRLNGKRVPLKQIRDLLMGTGLGLRAYSIIEQGKIGLILSGKPQERRRLLEEAAGVTRYKQRRRIAELKLEEATANLLRLDDIVLEVERALRSLKRQASAARRFGEKKTEYTGVLEQVLLGRWSRLDATRRERQSRLGEATSTDAALVAEVHRLEASLARDREQLEVLAGRVAELHQGDAELAARIEGHRAGRKGNLDNLEQLGERLTAGDALAEERRRQIEDHASALDRLAESRRDLEAERSEAAHAVLGDESALSQGAVGLEEAAERQETLRARLLTSVNELNQARGQLHQHQLESEKAGLRAHHLADEVAEHGRETNEAQSGHDAIAAQISDLEGRLERRRAEREALAISLDALLGSESTLNHRVQERREEARQAQARREILAELETAHAAGREAFFEQLRAVGLDQPRLLAEAIRAPEGWERAVDVWLDLLHDAVLLPPGTDVADLARRLTDARVSATLLTPLSSGPTTSPPNDPAVLGSLAAALAFPEPLARALPPTYLVEDDAAAERLARLHPSAAFLSRSGRWSQAGLVRVDGERRVPGVQERRQELETLEERLPELARDLTQAEEELDSIVAARTSRAEEIHHHDVETTTGQRELAVAQARLEDAATRLRRLDKLAREHERETARLAAERERLVADTEALGQLVTDLTVAHANLQDQLTAAQTLVEEARREREQLRAEGATRRGELQLLEERLRGVDLEAERRDRDRRAAETLIATWGTDREALAARRESLQGELERAEAELVRALEAREGSQEAILGAQAELDDERDAMRGRQDEVEAKRSQRDATRQTVEELRVELAGLQGEVEHLRQTFREQLGRELPPAGPTPQGDLDDLEVRLAELKADLERLGPVNELAAQEYDEQFERHGELVEQRADVAESVASLRRTIKEINATSNERFRATFEAVNQQFGETFVSLFGGGEAEMRLLDEDDLLESGIEIVARPPGKRLQNLLLLSGGEKALTAIALLMALFQTKASPFCILDEVDAPLDDPNTVRFVDIVRRMSEETQFIVITHNKLTMQAASTLYGVTMQERGVSTTVSVTVDDVQPEIARRAG